MKYRIVFHPADFHESYDHYILEEKAILNWYPVESCGDSVYTFKSVSEAEAFLRSHILKEGRKVVKEIEFK